ncbi:MAG: hypothetical protein IJ455_05010 [Agathobacter sp.]|nr:hypothetical protein [Agathobacter sp.]
MIRDIKLGFRLLKYGLNAKSSIIPMGICIILGVIMDLLWFVGGFSNLFLGMGSMILIQQIHSITISTMVQSSPYKKRLQTVIPTLVSGVYLLIAHTLCLILRWISYEKALNNTNPDFIIIYAPGEYETGMLFTALLLVFITLYTALSMKCFWLGSIIFIGSFMWFSNNADRITYMIMPAWLAVILSYGIILLGCGITYLIFYVTYKREYSKPTFDMQLKRAK